MPTQYQLPSMALLPLLFKFLKKYLNWHTIIVHISGVWYSAIFWYMYTMCDQGTWHVFISLCWEN
jgi:hypothetical protein